MHNCCFIASSGGADNEIPLFWILFCWCQSIGCYSIRRRSTFYANFHGRVSSRMLRLLFSKRCFNDFLMVEMNAQFSMWQLPGNSTLLHKKHSGQTCSSSSLIYYFIALLLTLVKFLLWCFYAHTKTIECYSWKSVIIWWLFCQKQPRKQGIRVGRLLLVQVTLRLVRMTRARSKSHNLMLKSFFLCFLSFLYFFLSQRKKNCEKSWWWHQKRFHRSVPCWRRSRNLFLSLFSHPRKPGDSHTEIKSWLHVCITQHFIDTQHDNRRINNAAATWRTTFRNYF